MQEFTSKIAEMADITNIDCELLNARAKRDAEEADSNEVASAKHTLREGMANSVMCWNPTEEEETLGDNEAMTVSGHFHGLKLFHSERLHMLAMGDSDIDAELRNPCTGVAWDATHAAWNDAGPEARTHYEMAAVASNNTGYNVLIGKPVLAAIADGDRDNVDPDMPPLIEDDGLEHPHGLSPNDPPSSDISTFSNTSLAPVDIQTLTSAGASLKSMAKGCETWTATVKDHGPIAICKYSVNYRQWGTSSHG